MMRLFIDFVNEARLCVYIACYVVSVLWHIIRSDILDCIPLYITVYITITYA